MQAYVLVANNRAVFVRLPGATPQQAARGTAPAAGALSRIAPSGRDVAVMRPAANTEAYGEALSLAGRAERLGEVPVGAVAVLELGMSAPGEIRSLSAIAEPDVAAITRVAPVHL